ILAMAGARAPESLAGRDLLRGDAMPVRSRFVESFNVVAIADATDAAGASPPTPTKRPAVTVRSDVATWSGAFDPSSSPGVGESWFDRGAARDERPPLSSAPAAVDDDFRAAVDAARARVEKAFGTAKTTARAR